MGQVSTTLRDVDFGFDLEFTTQDAKFVEGTGMIAGSEMSPAIDITKSGTRREELLFEKDELSKMNVLRRIISPMGTMDGIEFLISKLKNTKNNADFFDSMNKTAN